MTAPEKLPPQAFELIVERSAEGAVVIDDQNRIVYCNRAFERISGRSRLVLAGMDFRTLAGDVDADVEETVRRPGDERSFYELRLPEGEPIPVAISESSLGDGAGLRCLMVFDLRDREAAARAHEDRRVLEVAAGLKDELIAMLGHELRNPLAPIRTAAELLDNPDLEASSLRRIKSVILRQTDHMRRLVDDLLDAGRIARGVIRLQLEDGDIREAVAAAVESTQRLVERRQHTLSVQQPAEPLAARADLVRVTPLVSNLIANASKFTPAGGNIEVSTFVEEDDVVIRVTDDGVGIEPSLIDALFEPFVQGPMTLARSEGGLGLGLTLVRRFANLHDGSVQARSAGKGRGSEFEVRLPRAGPPPEERGRMPVRKTMPRRPEDPPSGPKSLTILVCDDNPDAAEMLTLLLRLRGHTADEVNSGEEALARLPELNADMVFLDIGLPGMDGFEVASRIRKASAPGAKLVAISGYGSDADRRRAKEAGFDAFLVKPVSASALDQTLRAARGLPT